MKYLSVLVISIMLFMGCDRNSFKIRASPFNGFWDIEAAVIDSLNYDGFDNIQIHNHLLLNIDGTFVVPIYTRGIYRQDVGRWTASANNHAQYIRFESSHALFNDVFEVSNIERSPYSVHESAIIGFTLSSRSLLLKLSK